MCRLVAKLDNCESIERALLEIDVGRSADVSSAKRSEAGADPAGATIRERVADVSSDARRPGMTDEVAPESKRCTSQPKDVPTTEINAHASRASADCDVAPDIAPNVEFRSVWFTEMCGLLSVGWKIAATPAPRGIAGWLERAVQRLRPLVYRPIQNDVRPDAPKDRPVDVLDDAAREDASRARASGAGYAIACDDGSRINISAAAGPDCGTMRFEWSMTHPDGRVAMFKFDASTDLCTELWRHKIYNALAANPEFRARLSMIQSIDASLRIPSAPNHELPDALARVVEKGSKAKFGDLHKLRSGRDRFSSMKLPDLEEAAGPDATRAARDHCRQFDAWERVSLNERILRWHLRGLPIDMAARKIDVDLEVRANAQKTPGTPLPGLPVVSDPRLPF